MLQFLLRYFGTNADYERALWKTLLGLKYRMFPYLCYYRGFDPRTYRGENSLLKIIGLFFELGRSESTWERRPEWKSDDMMGKEVDNSGALGWGCPKRKSSISRPVR
jgi:hypothetical protein